MQGSAFASCTYLKVERDAFNVSTICFVECLYPKLSVFAVHAFSFCILTLKKKESKKMWVETRNCTQSLKGQRNATLEREQKVRKQ